MIARVLALSAALAMGASPWAGGGAGSILWVELCSASHRGARIPLPDQPMKRGSPGQACHADCGMVGRRLGAGLPERDGER